MAKKLQLKFDPNLDYQAQAIDAVSAVFHGLPPYTSQFALGDDTVPNLPSYQTLDEAWLRDNVTAVQEANGIPRSGLLIDQLDVDEGLQLDGVSDDSWRYPSFTLEMETGTGKTYVYLRTIHELRRNYGFRKFIVVVPSIAIYEGVVKTFEVTKSHFAALYGNETVNLIRYDSSRLSKLRDFASSSFVEILVVTIDSFNKKTNRIYRASEQLPGERLPYEYVQETRPILILDEPQNMATDLAKSALRTLNPLFALRYSATHRETPNLLYQLTPFEAFQRGLVKRIKVMGVSELDNLNQDFVALVSVGRRPRIHAVVRTQVLERGSLKEEEITLHQGDDLGKKTKREEHRSGFKVAEIHAGNGTLEFENGEVLALDQTLGRSRTDVFRAQIESTIRRHMERQMEVKGQGIKVLSLFFIDRVANYVDDDGIIRLLFDRAFDQIKTQYPDFRDWEPQRVRSSYFAQRRIPRSDLTEAVDTSGRTKAERELEKEAFQLIMRDKEQLLSEDEKVSFIFAHSALKEGWDNPNVFQICTLNQTVSETKKRQEIGRGLRIAVNQQGERVFEEDVNVLTVVANESYERYARLLQTEYREDGQAAPPPPTRAGRTVVHRNEKVFNDVKFRAFWEKLLRRTTYKIHVDTEALIEECLDRLNNRLYPQPRIVVQTGDFVVTRLTLELLLVSGETARIRVGIQSTAGRDSSDTMNYRVRDDLADTCREPRLRGFRISSIDRGAEPKVTFANEQVLYAGVPITFETQEGQQATKHVVTPEDHAYPVPNLIERTAKETGLTRPTLNRIFQGMSAQKKANLLKNPEGFVSAFITEVQNALADHVVDHIEFVFCEGEVDEDLDELFPEKRDFPQRELVDGTDASLYDQVQVDSDVEKDFVRFQLDHRDVLGYFKFPPAFRIPFPKLIGNYNPDWGILRRDDTGQIVLQLVRETKGSEELRKLQFPHERRKVRAAQKHFKAIGLDYRVITDETPGWWRPSDEIPTQESLPTGKK